MKFAPLIKLFQESDYMDGLFEPAYIVFWVALRSVSFVLDSLTSGRIESTKEEQKQNELVSEVSSCVNDGLKQFDLKWFRSPESIKSHFPMRYQLSQLPIDALAPVFTNSIYPDTHTNTRSNKAEIGSSDRLIQPEYQQGSMLSGQNDPILQDSPTQLLNSEVIEKIIQSGIFGNISINDFTFLEVLGKGAFGTVYKVSLNKDNSIYALKVQRKEKSSETGIMDVYISNEIEVLKTISHEYIVGFYTHFTSPNFTFMLMECIKGKNLSTIIRERRRLEEDAARLVAAELILFLEYIRSKRIIFGDLKSENVMIRMDGHIKVIDFGSARVAQEDGYCREFVEIAKGRLDYISPEYLTNRPQSYFSDLWSLVYLDHSRVASYMKCL